MISGLGTVLIVVGCFVLPLGLVAAIAGLALKIDLRPPTFDRRPVEATPDRWLRIVAHAGVGALGAIVAGALLVIIG